MITIDITMPIHIVNMLLLIVIMNAVLYRPIRSILIERAKKIAGMEKDIETFEKNSQLQLEEFNKKLIEARGKAKNEFDAAKSAATSASTETLTGIRKEADAMKTKQLSDIEGQFATARQQLRGQLDGIAADMASKIMGRAMS